MAAAAAVQAPAPPLAAIARGSQSPSVRPLPVLVMGERLQDSHRLFICSFPDCGAAYNKSWKLDAHMCKHTGLRPFGCASKGCDKRFCTKYHLNRHALSHSGERPYRCTADGCSEAFTTSSNMKKHVARRHHNKEKLYVCDYEGCGREFKKHNQLKSHEFEHTNVLPYECNFEGCGRRFPVPSKLKRHEKVHKGYSCTEDGCSFQGKTWTEYQKHRKDQHQVQLQCPTCTKLFWNVWNFQQHQYVHQKERPVFCCPREGCQRTYTTAFNLQSHILSFHEELRPFSCSHPGCDKTFAMKQSLQRHSVVHDPEKKQQKKSRPKRSLASRLSGYQPKRSIPSEQSKLAVLLQDATLREANGAMALGD
ncbi:general transcription factor IIIA, b [Scleropages formosus]|uniref:Transcription factor IIIA n=1 Tax=Scleropages formosus TaxID=113540 RepID=A0A8C9SQG0_SCLFO|nr:transcription factor IIIA [Scleropages formosus]